MSVLIFSSSAIFRLQRLGSLYYRHTGERHRLSNEKEVLNLLHGSASIESPKIKDAYDAFLIELDEYQIAVLMEHGILFRPFE